MRPPTLVDGQDFYPLFTAPKDVASMGPPTLVDGQQVVSVAPVTDPASFNGAADSRRRTALVGCCRLDGHVASMGPPTLVDGQTRRASWCTPLTCASMGPPTLVDGQAALVQPSATVPSCFNGPA